MDRKEMIQAARRGDRTARKALGRWLLPILVDYFSGAVRAREREEACQNAMRDVIAKLALAPDDPEQFLGWTLGFANIEARRTRREAGRHNARIAALLGHGESNPPEPPECTDEIVLTAEQRQLVFQHADDLDEIYREAVLNALAQRTNRDLAKRLGIPENTARWRLWEGTRRIRVLIQDARVTRTPFRTPPEAV